MKQMHTTMRKIPGTLAATFAAVLFGLAAAGTAWALEQVAIVAVDGPVDTREGVRGADEVESIALTPRLEGSGLADLWIDDTKVATVDAENPDGSLADAWYEWTYPTEDEDPAATHEVTLRQGDTVLYKALFGRKGIYGHSAASGVWYGWLAQWNQWNRFVDLQFEGDYEKAGNGFAANGWRMYDAYVASIDPSNPDAKVRMVMERFSSRNGARDAEDDDQVFIWCDGSITTEATGSRRYILEAADSLVPDEEGNEPVWTPVCELPNGFRTFTPDEARALGRFLRVKVALP